MAKIFIEIEGDWDRNDEELKYTLENVLKTLGDMHFSSNDRKFSSSDVSARAKFVTGKGEVFRATQLMLHETTLLAEWNRKGYGYKKGV